MRVVVTGAAGFIGSNLVRGLNALGIDDVIAVDDMTDGPKYRNLLGARMSDYFDRGDFYARFARGEFGKVDAVFHEGACSDTMEHNGKFMLDNNYRCSKDLLDACLSQGTRLLYASSAATYGASDTFREEPRCEQPLNVYGYSKLLFDEVVRRHLPSAATQVAGFRYFNVYGPREQHKGRMASVAFHHFHEFERHGRVKLFGEYGGYGPGQQERDFVFVDDVVAVNLWFLEHPQASGIFNLGTGRAQPFNDIALTVVNAAGAAGVKRWQRWPSSFALVRSSTSTSPTPCAASTSATPRPTWRNCARPVVTMPLPTWPPVSVATSTGWWINRPPEAGSQGATLDLDASPPSSGMPAGDGRSGGETYIDPRAADGLQLVNRINVRSLPPCSRSSSPSSPRSPRPALSLPSTSTRPARPNWNRSRASGRACRPASSTSARRATSRIGAISSAA